jgi:hypothetical protein
MKIKCKAGTEFLTINVVGDSEHLNPFDFNIEKIKSIREYAPSYSKTDKSSSQKKKMWAIVIGSKVYATNDLDFDDTLIGDTVEIGSFMFECCITTSLTERAEYKTLINHKNTLYIRKYLKNNNKNDSNNSENLDKFAIITKDERIVPIVK